MENSYPVLPSFSTLFSDIDESDSAGISPADNPTSSKRGESSHSAFGSPSYDDSFEMWRSAGLSYDDDQGYHPSSSSWQMSNGGYGERMQTDEMDAAMDMDMSCYDEEPSFTKASPQCDVETKWPTWDSTNRLALSIPTSAARSSFEYSPSHERTCGPLWPGSRHKQQYDVCGPESSPTLGTSSFDINAYLEDNGPPLYQASQPLHSPHDPTQSPYSYIFPASLSSIVSPLASSASPSSSSTSQSSSPDIIIRTPTIPLHQPRPGRPIPIIPLSELASACEDFYVSPSSTRATFLKPDPQAINIESSDLLSPLDPEFRVHYTSSFSPKPAPRYGNSNKKAPYFGRDENYLAADGVRYSYGSGITEIFCACGCMESHTIPYTNNM